MQLQKLSHVMFSIYENVKPSFLKTFMFIETCGNAKLTFTHMLQCGTNLVSTGISTNNHEGWLMMIV